MPLPRTSAPAPYGPTHVRTNSGVRPSTTAPGNNMATDAWGEKCPAAGPTTSANPVLLKVDNIPHRTRRGRPAGSVSAPHPEACGRLVQAVRALARQNGKPARSPTTSTPRHEAREYVSDLRLPSFEVEATRRLVPTEAAVVTKSEKRFPGDSTILQGPKRPLVTTSNNAAQAESLYKRDVDYAFIRWRVQITTSFHRPPSSNGPARWCPRACHPGRGGHGEPVPPSRREQSSQPSPSITFFSVSTKSSQGP